MRAGVAPAGAGAHDGGPVPPSRSMSVSLLDFLAGGLLQFGFWPLAAVFLVATQLTIFSVTL